VIGTHTMRKTAYLFGVFGILYKYENTGRRATSGATGVSVQCLEDDALTKAARHKSNSSASLYYESSVTAWHELGCHSHDMWAQHKVSEWKGIFYSEGRTCRANSNMKTRTSMDVGALSRWWVKEELKICSSSQEVGWVATLNHATKTSPNLNKIEEMRQILCSLPQGMGA
jgi:hypothetical protein